MHKEFVGGVSVKTMRISSFNDSNILTNEIQIFLFGYLDTWFSG